MKIDMIRKYIKEHPVLWFLGLVFPPVFSFMGVFISSLFGSKVMALISTKNAKASSMITIIIFAVLGIAITEIFYAFFKYLNQKFKIFADIELKQDIFLKIIKGYYRKIVKHDGGELYTKYNQDIEMLTKVMTDDIYYVVYPIITGIGSIVSIFIANPIVGAFALVFATAVIVLNVIYVKRFQIIESDKRIAADSFNTDFNSIMQGKMTVRLFSVQNEMADRIGYDSEKIRNFDDRSARLYLKKGLSTNWFIYGTATMVMPLACLLAVLGSINLPDLVFVTQMCGSLIFNTGTLGTAIIDLNNDTVSAARVAGIMDTSQETFDPEKKSIQKDRSPVLEMDDVSISYDLKPAVRNINFTVNKGEIFEIVGGSGSGKSTVLKAVIGLINYSGEIYFYGENIKNYNIQDVRNNISYVSEGNELMDGTVTDNICFGKQEADERLIKDAMRQAALDELVSDGEINVGNEGDQLSGGQKQRIGIARAFLKDAPVYLMDEPTSGIDGKSEDKVLQSILEKKNNGHSFVIVTHRKSTLKIADKIAVIENGTLKNTDFDDAVEYLDKIGKEC